MIKAYFPIETTDDGKDIFVNDEHLLNKLSGIISMSPLISRETTPLKIFSPNFFIEEGIVICVNDEHPLNTESLIDFTEDGINICCKDEHSLKAP